jgi:hypothetical protein
MEERSVHRDVALPAHHQATKISQPGEGSCHFPAPLIAPQLPTVLQGRFRAVLAMRTKQVNASLGQTLAQWVRVTGLVINQPRGALAGPSTALPWHSNRLQRRLHQCHFGGGRRVQEVSQRNTLAVDRHHPFRAFAPFGFADAGPPFFAGAKLPSTKAADQSS